MIDKIFRKATNQAKPTLNELSQPACPLNFDPLEPVNPCETLEVQRHLLFWFD